jgi:hypothetical protein
MKKILLIAFLIIPFIGFSQTTKPIDGVLGIKFGASKAATLAAIKTKGGIWDKQQSTASGMSVYKNVKFGRRTSIGVALSFYAGKFYSAVFLFKADDDPHTIDYYDDLVSDLSDVYGAGTPTKTFRSPFTDGDGHEITAIEGGYADYYTDWESNDNTIQVSINTHFYVTLSYSDGAIRANANAKRKAKDNADY